MQGLPTEGTFGVVDSITLLSFLWKKNFDGAVKIEEGSIHRIIYVKDGSIISLATNHPDEKIDDLLIAEGKITKDHIRQALAESGSFATLPENLEKMGFITSLELKEAHRLQMQKLLGHIASRPGAIYSLVEGYTPSRTTLFDYAIPRALKDFFLRTENRDFVLSIIGNPESGIVFDNSKKQVYDSLEIGHDADEIVRLLDGKCTMAELAAQSKWKEFDVYRLFALFISLNLAERAKITPVHKPEEMSVPHLSDMPTVTLEEPAASEEDGPWEDEPAGKDELPPGPKELDEPEEESEVEYIAQDAPPVISIPLTSQEKDFQAPPSPPKRVIKPEPELIQRSDLRRERRRKFLVIYPLAGIFAVLIIAIASYFYLGHRDTPQQVKPNTPSVVEEPGNDPTSKPDSSGADAEGGEAKPADTPEPDTRPNSEAPAETRPSPLKQPDTRPIKQPGSSKIIVKAKAHVERVRNSAGSNFTIQLMIACVDDTIREAETTDSSGKILWYAPYNYKGRDCYKVFWGTFSSKSEAERNRSSVPSIFKKDGSSPQVLEVNTALANVSH